MTKKKTKKFKTKKIKQEVKHKKRTAKRIGERWITKEKEKVKLTKKEQIFEDRVKAVISRGRERGFVMEAEILKFFPNVEESQGFIKDAVPEPTEDEINRALNIGADDTIASDSVQMYLREIGRTPLLTGNEEKALAKKIEKADIESRNKLIQA